MKRSQRDTTVFSLSALDLFCSAMGVFMVLSFIALPSFPNTSTATPEPTPAQPEPTPAPTPAPPVKLACLVVSIEWRENTDIDLHVFDPQGNHFYWPENKKQFPNSPALLTQDSRTAGKEIWVSPLAKPGKYEIYCNLFAMPGRTSPTSVKMTLMSASGTDDLRPFTLTQAGRDKGKHIATIIVKEDATIEKTLHY